MPKEYIEREALEEQLNKRLKYLRKEYGNYDQYTDGYDEAVDTVETAPAADVVEVVRCKDCKYWECVCGGTTGRCESPRNGLFYDYTDNFDFCSYGERSVRGE